MGRANVGVTLVLVVLLAAYYSTCSVLIHRTFHSNGWDLGIFDQVLWNTAHGHPFAYSFRPMLYLGDHWQPALLLLVPLDWFFEGAEPLLIVQGIAFAVAIVPLWFAGRRLGGTPLAWAATVAYAAGLGVTRAVEFDFHMEAFVPVVVFTALWALATERRRWFLAMCGVCLLLKEDGPLLVLALTWLAFLRFGWRRDAAVVVGIAMAHLFVVSAIIIPYFAQGNSSPFAERYGYLAHTNLPNEPFKAPWLFLQQITDGPALGGLFLVFAGCAFLALLKPHLLPALAVVTVPALASEHGPQHDLHLHYMVTPSVIALAIAVIALADLGAGRLLVELARVRRVRNLPALPAHVRDPLAIAGTIALVVATGYLFMIKAPLPPSTIADGDHFRETEHTRLAYAFLAMIPKDAPVSAHANYVPHLSGRRQIYEFPVVKNAEFIMLDGNGYVPGFDEPHFETCLGALDALGFAVLREESGYALYYRVRERSPGAPPEC